MEEKLFEKKLISYIQQISYIEVAFGSEQDVNKFKEILNSFRFNRTLLYDYFLNNRITIITLNNFCNNLIDSINYLKTIHNVNTTFELNDAIDELYDRNDNFRLAVLSWPEILWGIFKKFEPNTSLVNSLGWNGISFISNETYRFGSQKYYFYNKETPFFDTVIHFKKMNLSTNPIDADIETFLNSFKKEELFNYFSKYVSKKSISKNDFIQEISKSISIKDLNNYGIDVDYYFKFLRYEHLFPFEEIKNHYYYYRHKMAVADVFHFINDKYLENDESLRIHCEWKKDNFYYIRWTTNCM